MSNCFPQPGRTGTAKLFALLVDGANRNEIATATGLHPSTVMRMIHALQALEVCYIADWDEDTRGRRILAVHKIGKNMKDKPRPMTRRSDPELRRGDRRDRYQMKADARLLGILEPLQ